MYECGRRTSGWIGLIPEVHCRDKTAVHSEYVQNLAIRKNIPLKALDELVHPDVCHASIFLGHCKRFGLESFLLGAGGFVKHADDRTLTMLRLLGQWFPAKLTRTTCAGTAANLREVGDKPNDG